MSAGACADALRSRGTSLVRGVLPPHLFPAMIEDIEAYFRWLATGERLQEAALYTNYGNIFFATGADFGERSLVDVLRCATIPPLRDAVCAYFQSDRLSIFLGYSFIRRHWPCDTKVDLSVSPR